MLTVSPSTTEEAQGCLPLGGEIGRVHMVEGALWLECTVLSWVAGTLRTDGSALASQCLELESVDRHGRHAVCSGTAALGETHVASCPSSVSAG